MNILMISNDATMFDAESSTVRRMRALSELGVQLTIVVIGRERALREVGGIPMLGISGSVRSLPFVTGTILKKLKNKFDLVTAQDPLKCGFVGRRLSAALEIPLEIQMHGDWFSGYYASRGLKSRLALLFAQNILRSADLVRAVSSRVAHSLIKLGIKEECLYVAPIKVDELSGETTLPEPYTTEFANKKIILCVGRLSPEKHVDLLANAFPAILGSIPNAALVIVGEGNQSQLIKATAKSLGCREQLYMIGNVDDVSPWYRNAAVIAIPSHSESFSRVVIEATAAGKPIVMTDVGLAGDVIINRISGRVISEDNPGLFAEAIIETINNPEQAKEFVTNAQKIVTARFSQNPQHDMIAAWRGVIS